MGPTTRETVLKTNVNDINLVKLLIPKILIGSKQYLLADIEDDLTYLKIKEFYQEYNGDLDNCRGHYQLQTRTKMDFLPVGRIEFWYIKIGHTEFNIRVTNQGQGDMRRVDEITDNVKRILDQEKIAYEELNLL